MRTTVCSAEDFLFVKPSLKHTHTHIYWMHCRMLAMLSWDQSRRLAFKTQVVQFYSEAGSLRGLVIICTVWWDHIWNKFKKGKKGSGARAERDVEIWQMSSMGEKTARESGQKGKETLCYTHLSSVCYHHAPSLSLLLSASEVISQIQTCRWNELVCDSFCCFCLCSFLLHADIHLSATSASLEWIHFPSSRSISASLYCKEMQFGNKC